MRARLRTGQTSRAVRPGWRYADRDNHVRYQGRARARYRGLHVTRAGEGARKRLDGTTEFDWYGGHRLGIATRRRGTEEELFAVDLETGREESLFVGALQEIDVAPDGSAVAFCFGRGHMSMGLALLKLERSADRDGLPSAIGEPQYIVQTEGTWHVHKPGWSPDSKTLIYTEDKDYGDIYELVER